TSGPATRAWQRSTKRSRARSARRSRSWCRPTCGPRAKRISTRRSWAARGCGSRSSRSTRTRPRSEERRVGKECRCGWVTYQAEDGIRDFHVTGVQTCALPIYVGTGDPRVAALDEAFAGAVSTALAELVSSDVRAARKADLDKEIVGRARLWVAKFTVNKDTT